MHLYPLVNDILRLEVPVNDLVLMHVVQRSADLTHDVPRHVLGHSSALLEVTVQLP